MQVEGIGEVLMCTRTFADLDLVAEIEGVDNRRGFSDLPSLGQGGAHELVERGHRAFHLLLDQSGKCMRDLAPARGELHLDRDHRQRRFGGVHRTLELLACYAAANRLTHAWAALHTAVRACRLHCPARAD